MTSSHRNDRTPAWRRYLRFWGSDARDDVDEELRFHLEMRTAEYVAEGMSPADARRLAAKRLGNLERAREECVDVDEQYARKEQRVQMLMTTLQDLTFALRLLRRQWFPAAMSALCVAVGVAATTGMFSVADRLLLRPLPYPNAARMVQVNTARKGQDAGVSSYLDYLDWRSAQHTLTDLAALGQTDFVMQRGEATRVPSALVSANFFRTFGVTMEAGRDLSAADDHVGAPPVLVVSDAFARREFGGPRRAVGQTILLNGASRTIVGVVRDLWRFPSRTDAYVPLETGGYSAVARDPSQRGNRNLEVFGALKPGSTIDDARRDLAAIAARIAREYPRSNAEFTTAMIPLRDRYVGDARSAILAMIAATVLVLVIACANVAALQLARATTRSREIAVRAAIGAKRGRIVRQLLTENVTLALIGGLGGVLLSIWTRPFIGRAVVPGTPAWMTFDLDGRVLAFALIASMMTGILVRSCAGITPWRHDSARRLARRRELPTRLRLQSAFVVTEIALSMLLVVGAGLAVESVRRTREIPLGFDPQGVLTFRVSLQGARYGDPQSRATFVAAVVDRLRAIPGVAQAGAADRAPVIGCCSHFTAQIEGHAAAPGHDPMITGTIATPGYFAALGIRTIAGRTFTANDDSHSPLVTVINESFAKRYWPNGDAIGHHVKTGIGDALVVGVVGDIRQEGLLVAPAPQFFRPYAEDPWTTMTYFVRTARDPLSLVPAIRRAVHDVEPTVPVFETATMQSIVDDASASSRSFGQLATVFAAVALLLAAAGLYGVMSFTVERRTRELGLRVALGAEPRTVARMVLRQALVIAAAGSAFGLAGTFMAARWLASVLYGVHAGEPAVYLTAAVLLGVTVLAAAYGPARRASRSDPMLALRC